jgi:hypothetical protein
VLTAFIAIGAGTPEATGVINTSGIAKGAITFNRLSPGVQRMVSAKATKGVDGTNALGGANGAPGAPGTPGAVGA